MKDGRMNAKMFGFIFKTMRYKMAGRLHSPTNYVGTIFTNATGQEFVIFKQTVLDPLPCQAEMPKAIFRVQFRVRKIIPWRDRFIIAIKSPLFVAPHGFRSKLWMVDKKNNTYQGVYEWATVADAEAYGHSASMDFMTRVALPGGISYEIIPGGKIKQLGQRLSIE
jgi:hypothetical protein